MAPAFCSARTLAATSCALPLLNGVHLDVADAVLDHLVGHGRHVDDVARDHGLLRLGATGANYRHVQVRAGLSKQQTVDFGQGHFTRALAFDGFEDIAGLNAGLVGRTPRNNRDDRGIAKALRNRCSDFAFGVSLVGLVLFKLGGGQIAGIRIQRLQQAVQRAVGDGGDVGFFHIFAAHSRQHLAVNLQLAVGAIVIGSANAIQSTHRHEQQNSGGGNYNCGLGLHGHRI